MTDLYPTPTRLALLRAVKAHDAHPQRGVFAVARQGKVGFDSYEATTDGRGDVKVTARAEEALAAGWITRGPAGVSFFSRRWYRLTEAGDALITAQGQEE